MRPVRLYCNPATSEVADEHPSLIEALAAGTPSADGSLLVCNGTILATAVARGWLLDQSGIERLRLEFAHGVETVSS